MAKETHTVKTHDGKYTTHVFDNGSIKIDRYGQEWREETGDGYILSLIQEIQELQNSKVPTGVVEFHFVDSLHKFPLEFPMKKIVDQILDTGDVNIFHYHLIQAWPIDKKIKVTSGLLASDGKLAKFRASHRHFGDNTYDLVIPRNSVGGMYGAGNSIQILSRPQDLWADLQTIFNIIQG